LTLHIVDLGNVAYKVIFDRPQTLWQIEMLKQINCSTQLRKQSYRLPIYHSSVFCRITLSQFSPLCDNISHIAQEPRISNT